MPFIPSQIVKPVAQMPIKPVGHCMPTPGLPSSMLPSQLLSRPSQSSGCMGAGVHFTEPLTQLSMPFLHSPTTPVAVHAPPPPGLSLSIAPLQSSSRPLHDSGEGVMLPMQSPHAPVVSHVCVPGLQTPVFPVPVGPG